MDPEQTFIRVQERFSQMLTPRIRSSLEYIYLFMAVALFCILVVLHANYVQQPGCSSEIFRAEISEAQLIQIQITTENNENMVMTEYVKAPNMNANGLLAVTKKFQSNLIPLSGWSGKLKSLWKTCKELPSYSLAGTKIISDRTDAKIIDEDPLNSFFLLMKTSCKCSVVGFIGKWYGRLLSFWRFSTQIFSGLKKFWNITGGLLKRVVPKWFHVLLENSGSLAVQWLEKRRKVFEPTYLYTLEKGYFFVPEAARPRHNIHTMNISISPQNTCFGNRWQQLLINRCVGYDTILINSLLNSPGQGYLYNFQTREFYNLSYAPTASATLGDYFVTKCGVLMMSLFVFFTTTISVSFTLRETQTRMLRFTVQLQHHARHRLPTFQLIFVHVVESLVFVPIMIGILFFLFEFYDDQLLAFMVLIVVWLCEVFTLISVRTPISMKFFPRFFLLYFLGFHIYFFSYGYGFSYLALSTTAAFMQHLILYFWNRFEVPALEMFMQNREAEVRQHEDIRITSSTILASTLHITRVNSRSMGELAAAQGPAQGGGGGGGGEADVRAMNSFSSLLLWILGGASSESLTSFLSLFRYVTDQEGDDSFPQEQPQQQQQQQNYTDESVVG